MKKLLSIAAISALLTTGAMAGEKKGLNVVLTAHDAQTQLMAIVKLTMTLKQKKKNL